MRAKKISAAAEVRVGRRHDMLWPRRRRAPSWPARLIRFFAVEQRDVLAAEKRPEMYDPTRTPPDHALFLRDLASRKLFSDDCLRRGSPAPRVVSRHRPTTAMGGQPALDMVGQL